MFESRVQAAIARIRAIRYGQHEYLHPNNLRGTSLEKEFRPPRDTRRQFSVNRGSFRRFLGTNIPNPPSEPE